MTFGLSQDVPYSSHALILPFVCRSAGFVLCVVTDWFLVLVIGQQRQSSIDRTLSIHVPKHLHSKRYKNMHVFVML